MSTVALGLDRRGTGPALVLLHPLGGDRTVWSPVLDRLAAEREVIAVDLPGFGSTPPLQEAPTPAALAAAVDRGLADVGVTDYAVAGNSLGGWVALELALVGRATSVVAIGPAGLWRAPLAPKRSTARTLARAILPVSRPLLATPALRRRALAMFAAHPDRIPPAAARRLIRAYATAPGFDAVQKAMRAGVFTGLERISVPVVLAWPDQDRIVARPSRLPPSIRSVTLHDCGHLPMWDDPAQVADLLLAGSAVPVAAQ